jgi:hypothetical protein
MNTVISNQNKIYDELTDNYLKLLGSIQKLSYINSTDNLVHRISDINITINTLNSEIEKLQHDIDIKEIQPSPNTISRIHEYKHAKSVMKPFMPYMLLYSLALQQGKSNDDIDEIQAELLELL